ncbi:MAG: hypothetical protein M1822_008898 [Bathelium mastoideum]|nr:MAG: hypothetical protein M1822_008898 [Bathelium mastoideum]
MANFAPYQSDTPENVRALSPSPPPANHNRTTSSPRRSLSSSPQPGNRNRESARQPRNITEVLPSPGQYTDGADDSYQNGSGQYFDDPAAAEEGRGGQDEEQDVGFGGGGSNGIGGVGRGWNGRDVDVFETSLPLRMDLEACVPYLLIPPAGGVLILLLEHKSDYVRFHAWQSSLLVRINESQRLANSRSFFLQFTVIFVVHLVFSFSAVISWLLFAGDLLLIGWLTFRAYRDGEIISLMNQEFD